MAREEHCERGRGASQLDRTNPGEEERRRGRTERDVAGALGHVEALEVADLERRLAVRVEDLGRRLAARAAARVDKLLEEDLAEDAVRLLLEDGREDDGDAVGRGEEVDGFFGPASAKRERERERVSARKAAATA